MNKTLRLAHYELTVTPSRGPVPPNTTPSRTGLLVPLPHPPTTLTTSPPPPIAYDTSSSKLSLSSATTSVIDGRSLDGRSLHFRANSATFQTELTSYSPPIRGSATFEMSPSESFWRTHSATWMLSVLLMETAGGWPVISSSSTTPKLYTSLFSLSWDVCTELQTLGRVKSDLESLMPSEGMGGSVASAVATRETT
ncbi:hypothetical protein U9M48_037105 [Paspalum notatum var. saurae]|uniref:Uncharacterized protein n=1 Tax=Paspalum notatum var. saurae TaxID=547442 RepID=A0AAQ3X8X5_PASNO